MDGRKNRYQAGRKERRRLVIFFNQKKLCIRGGFGGVPACRFACGFSDNFHKMKLKNTFPSGISTIVFDFGGVILDEQLWANFDSCRSTDYTELVNRFLKLKKVVDKL